MDVLKVLLLLIWAAAPLSAETLTVEGLPLRLDALRAVDENNVDLEVGGERRLVAKSALEDTAVELFFKPNGHARSVEAEQLEKFIEKSLQDGHANYAGQALPFYLSAPSLDVLGAQGVLERLGTQPEAAEAFKQALLAIRSNGDVHGEFRSRPGLVSVVLFTIGVADGEWLRANALRWVFAFSESFHGYLVDRLARAAAANDLPQLRAIVSVVQEAFGDDNEFFLSLRLLVKRIEQVSQYTSSQPVDSLYPLVEGARRDPLSARILYPLVADKLHTVAEQALQDGSPQRAIAVISRTDPARRTPRTHELLRQALRVLPGSDRELIRDSETDAMITTVALRDVQIHRLYEEFLARVFIDASSHSDFADARAVLARMLKIRPDPDPNNDDLRTEIALLSLRSGDRDSALSILGDIQTGIPLYDRLRLGLAGLYVNRFVAFLCIVVPGVYTFWFLLVELRRLRSFRLQRSATQRSHRTEGNHAAPKDDADSSAYDRNGGKVFTQTNLKKPTDPRLTEYQQCLTVLGLQPTASLKDIKSAYRSLVKHIHPDRLKENHGRASNRFIELTQAYDRALELRKMTGQEE